MIFNISFMGMQVLMSPMEERHIAFIVNTGGFNLNRPNCPHNDGVSGQIIPKYWPELANCGPKNLGEVMSETVSDKTFHAMVVCDEANWDDSFRWTSEMITKCLDSLPGTTDNDPIALLLNLVQIGERTGLLTTLNIIAGVARSKKRVAIYATY